MNAEYIQVIRRLDLAPAAVQTVSLPAGTPYRHLIVWMRLGNALTGPDKITLQLKFAGEDVGGLIDVDTAGMSKIFQAPADEIRPQSRSLKKHPDDESVAGAPLFEVEATNNALSMVSFDLYMIASAAPGGA